MPGRVSVNYEENTNRSDRPTEVRQVRIGKRDQAEKPQVEAVQVQKKPQQPKKTASLLDQDDQTPNVTTKAVEKQQNQGTDIFNSALGGFSFEQTMNPPSVAKPQNNDPFNIFGL